MSRLLTVPEVADRLGLSTRTIRKKISAGELPAIRLGPADTQAPVRVDEAELERWLHSDNQAA